MPSDFRKKSPGGTMSIWLIAGIILTALAILMYYRQTRCSEPVASKKKHANFLGKYVFTDPELQCPFILPSYSEQRDQDSCSRMKQWSKLCRHYRFSHFAIGSEETRTGDRLPRLGRPCEKCSRLAEDKQEEQFCGSPYCYSLYGIP